MLFDTHPECEALVESAERLVRERLDYVSVRRVLTDEPGYDTALWTEFAELGWLAAGVAEANGGLGLAPSVLSELVSALGPGAMSEPLISQLCFGGCLLDGLAASAPRDALLEAWIGGDALLALVDGRESGVDFAPHSDGGGVLTGTRNAVPDAGVASYFLVCLPVAQSSKLWLIERGAAGLEVQPQRAADGRALGDVEFKGLELEASAGLEPARAGLIGEVETLWALLLASESLGIIRAMQALTAEYLAQREQFGSKLIEFQALQHRLVDMRLACVRVESMIELARFKADELGLAEAAPYISGAKASAGQDGREVGQEAVQLHGGIGMTDELVIGHYLKRLIANELLGGHTVRHFEAAARARGLATG